MDKYINYLTNLVHSKYSTTIELPPLFNTSGGSNGSVITFNNFLIKLKDKKMKSSSEIMTTRVDSRVQDFLPDPKDLSTSLNSEGSISNILEVGAGKDADIILNLAKKLNIPQSKIFALDPKLSDNIHLNCLQYDNGKIPLPDKSIDLIILSMVLHHIDIIDRIFLIEELKRIITDNGIIQVREHYLPNDPLEGSSEESSIFTLFIELVHEFWYVYNDEEKDELYLMTDEECKNLFLDNGFKIIKENKKNNIQNVVNYSFSLNDQQSKPQNGFKYLDKYNEMEHNFDTIELIFKNSKTIPKELNVKKGETYSDYEWFQLMKQISKFF